MNDQIEGGCKVNVSRSIEGDCTKTNENTLQVTDSNISTCQDGEGGGGSVPIYNLCALHPTPPLIFVSIDSKV